MSALKRLSLAAAAAGLLAVPMAGPATFATTVSAQAPVNIKLATQVPVNSSWHKALLDMGAEWTAKTGGRVKLTVYAGGTQGSEDATVRMMRPGVDQLQANLLTVTGLAQIDEAFNVFGLPFFFESDAEALYVQQKLQPMLEKRVQAKGFQQLSWASVGWVQLFSKKPITTLAEVKSAKLFTSQGDEKMVQWYKNNGFNAVALSPTDIPAQLKLPNGMIDAAPSPPYGALVLQFFRDAKYMLDVRVAPLIGALVMTSDAWNKIAPADRPAIIAAAKAFEARVSAEAPKQDADSVATMKTRGLIVTPLDAKAAAAFRAESEKLLASMRGNIVPADAYDQARQERDAYRKTKGK